MKKAISSEKVIDLSRTEALQFAELYFYCYNSGLKTEIF